MGLDMYAYAYERSQIVDPEVMVDLEVTEASDTRARPVKDWYWRKFNQLHGWMSRLYYAKGGTDPDFNCNSVQLVLQDLVALEVDMKDPVDGLPHTPGFFFGGDTLHPEDIEDLKTFIQEAKDELAAGRVVYYSSWW